VTIDEFDLVIEIIGHFNTQLVSTFYKSLSHRLVFSVTVFTALLGNGALPGERRSLPFTIIAGPRQRSHSWFRVERDS
jgi:hypothetical protein